LGYLYSLGPLPISYTPFSEVLQILFFGIIAVGGVYYLHTGTITRDVLLTGMLFGLPGAAVLLTNNHRDRVGDRAAGRRTLPILIGEAGSRLAYAALLVTTAVGLGLMYCGSTAGCVAFALLLGFALILAARMAETPVSAALNRFIGRTALYQMTALAAAMVARATA
jgi:1,4-dihydroxy-2-naphthoate octaprenyltransferase